MIPLINKIYRLDEGVFNLDGISKNSRLLILPDGKRFVLTSGKIQAMIENNNRFHGEGRVLGKGEAARLYPESFEVPGDRLTDENVVAVLMRRDMFDFCKGKDPSPAKYIRYLIGRAMEEEKASAGKAG